jgi:hypothetical protein
VAHICPGKLRSELWQRHNWVPHFSRFSRSGHSQCRLREYPAAPPSLGRDPPSPHRTPNRTAKQHTPHSSAVRRFPLTPHGTIEQQGKCSGFGFPKSTFKRQRVCRSTSHRGVGSTINCVKCRFLNTLQASPFRINTLQGKSDAKPSECVAKSFLLNTLATTLCKSIVCKEFRSKSMISIDQVIGGGVLLILRWAIPVPQRLEFWN